MEIVISIHAPTRGATSINEADISIVDIFQSTLLQEERRWVGFRQLKWTSYFNPRSYKRSDGAVMYREKGEDLFQSTLLQEERHFPAEDGDHWV